MKRLFILFMLLIPASVVMSQQAGQTSLPYKWEEITSPRLYGSEVWPACCDMTTEAGINSMKRMNNLFIK